MGQISREAVADVKAGGGEIAPEKGFACVDTGFGIEVGVVVDCGGLGGAGFVFEEGRQFGVRASKLAGDVEDVAGVGSAATEGFIFWRGADENYVRKYKIRWRLGGITACKGDIVEICQAADAI